MEQPNFKLNQLVSVQSRTGPNENKPGGVGKISEVSEDGTLFTVKYVLGGKETGIHKQFISAHSFDIEARPRQPVKVIDDVRDALKSDIDANEEVDEDKVPSEIKKREKKRMKEASVPIKFASDSVQEGVASIENIAKFTNIDRERMTDPPVAKQQLSNGPSVSPEDLLFFTEQLRNLLQNKESILLEEALGIFSDPDKCRSAIKALQESDRIFVPDSEPATIWSI